MDKQVVISVKTILVAMFMVLAVYVLYRLGPIIGILLLASLLTTSMEPLVLKLMRINFLNKPISRGVAVAVSYILLVVVIAFVVTVGIPPVASQLEKMLNSLSTISAKINFGESFNFSLADLLPQASKLSSGVLTMTISLVSNISATVSLIILSLYLSMDWERIKKQFISLFSEDKEDEVEDTLEEVELNVSHWVKGELTLMFSIGLASFVGLQILGVKYPLALGIVSGVLEIVPILGPVISAILAGIIAFADTPIKGLGVIALYVIIQQLENNILVPKIMQKVSGFSPLVILIALLVGSEFFGVIGAIIAVPATIIGAVILKRVLRSNN